MADFGLAAPNIEGTLTDSVLGGRDAIAPHMEIAELTGERRVVVLRGRALPYRPVSWAGNMRVKTTWYQGNKVATQQVLGPELEPTTMNGKWKDRFMIGAQDIAGGSGSLIEVNGSSTEVRNAEAAAQLFEDIYQSGNKLRVVWGPKVREGILVFFDANYDRLQDIGWTMEFEWSSQGETERRAVEEPVSSDQMLNNMNALDDGVGFSPESVSPNFNAQLLDAIESARDSTGVIFDGLRDINDDAAVPQSVIGKISSAANSIRLELTEEIGRLTESSITGAEGAMGVAIRVASLLQVEAYRRTTARDAAVVRRDTLEVDRQTQLRAKPRLVRIVPVPQDTSLYTLSNRFYGSPDFANFLARSNGLTSAIAPAGFELRVPPKPAEGEAGLASFAC